MILQSVEKAQKRLIVVHSLTCETRKTGENLRNVGWVRVAANTSLLPWITRPESQITWSVTLGQPRGNNLSKGNLQAEI